ncbi:alpha/beta hydrolase [Prochlorococcus sp. MIT 1307]|uniref:alpha/beta hydrolase n=1 Tax=Prochlorococcus sp. MIT 1307 TaxID=3096219 RepID=UPI002A764623|nr:alpha/beta fold hydrolase [Prochlorococcus sp. MIT 1307]
MENELICEGTAGATHRLILLHGWGADAEDLISLGQVLRKGLKRNKLELIALRAPQLHPGGSGRQWYGLFPPDWSSVPAAIDALKLRIKAFCRTSIGLEKTVILGFSQGGAMALASGCELPLAGLIGCSAYPHPNWSPPENFPPVLLIHGLQDEVVPIDASRKLLTFFKAQQGNVDLLIFEGGHQIPEELIIKIQQALDKWLV